MHLIGIDIGPEHSAFCELLDGAIGDHAWLANDKLLAMLRSGHADQLTAVIESPQAQSNPLGKLLRDTVLWCGRFIEAIDNRATPWVESDERDVRLWLCGSRGANNGALLQSLKDHFGDTRQEACGECQSTGQVTGTRGPKQCPCCKGRKFLKVPGPLHGLNEHERSGLAVALRHWQQLEDRRETA